MYSAKKCLYEKTGRNGVKQPTMFLNGHFSPNVVNHYLISLPEDQLRTVVHIICIRVGKKKKTQHKK